jgi:hypothetical protein
MYEIISPNPFVKDPTRNSKTGRQSYYHKIGDGTPKRTGRYSTHNPTYKDVISIGNPSVNDKPSPGVRPGTATTREIEMIPAGKCKFIPTLSLLRPSWVFFILQKDKI